MPTPVAHPGARTAGEASPAGSGADRSGSRSPPLAMENARVSEPDVRPSAGGERLTGSSPNTPPLEAGILRRPRGLRSREPVTSRHFLRLSGERAGGSTVSVAPTASTPDASAAAQS